MLTFSFWDLEDRINAIDDPEIRSKTRYDVIDLIDDFLNMCYKAAGNNVEIYENDPFASITIIEEGLSDETITLLELAYDDLLDEANYVIDYNENYHTLDEE